MHCILWHQVRKTGTPLGGSRKTQRLGKPSRQLSLGAWSAPFIYQWSSNSTRYIADTFDGRKTPIFFIQAWGSPRPHLSPLKAASVTLATGRFTERSRKKTSRTFRPAGSIPPDLATLRNQSWVPSGNCVVFFISVTAMWECNSRIISLAVSVLRTKSS